MERGNLGCVFLGEQVATRRAARGWSQAQLGALLGNGKPALVADYEAGAVLPSPVIVLDLADMLSCEPAALFDSSDDPLLLAALALADHTAEENAKAPRPPAELIERLRQLLPRPRET